MNRYEQLKRKFDQRDKITGTAVTFLNEPALIEKMNREDLDFILFDMEHGRFDSQNLFPLLHICRVLGLPSIVRVQDSEYHLIAKTIDMGADGVMIPRVEKLEQIKTAIDSICFHPIGRKGVGGPLQFRKNESFEQFQTGRFLIPQVESQKGMDILPEMLDEYGEKISGIIVGPYDMSVMLGTPLEVKSPVMMKAVQQTIDICASRKKSVGIFCSDTEEAGIFRSMGANLLWTMADTQFFMLGFTETFDDLSKIP